MLTIRWSLFILMAIGLVKDLIAPYVKFPIPLIIEKNAATILVLCIIIALIIQIREVFTFEFSDSQRQYIDVGWKGFIRMILVISTGVMFSVFITITFAVLHGWFIDKDITIGFLVATFFLALGIWFSLPLGSTVKYPYAGFKA